MTVPPPPKRPLGTAATLALLALWLLATAGLRPLLLPDEGRYAGVARDMLWGVGAESFAGGRGWVPLLNGLPFFHKPPLMYWLDMAAMALFGVNQLTARFAPFVGAWVMGASMFLALRRWHGTAVAQRALWVLATCPFLYVGAQYANLDMLVGGLISATVLAFVRAVDGQDVAPDVGRGGAGNTSSTGQARAPLRWLLAAWALAALAVLAKGLIGIVLPLLVVGPWLLAQRRWRDLRRLAHPLGLALFAVLALPWMLAMQWRYPGFFDYFIVEQHFRRFAGTTFNNVHPAWFYFLVLPALTLPWALWLPAAWRALRRGGPGDALPMQDASSPAPLSSSMSVAMRRRAANWQLALYAWWLLAIVGFFSLPASKLVGYVLPALAPWCLLLSLGTAGFGRWARITLAASALFSVGVVVALALPARYFSHSPPSSKPAALALAANIAPGDRVVFVDSMFYDLPFYAGLREPVTVASDWADPDLPKRDNWRKELADAARFDPARGRELLWPLDRLAELTCQPAAKMQTQPQPQTQAKLQTLWLVLTPNRRELLASVPGAAPVYADANVLLARAPGRDCMQP